MVLTTPATASEPYSAEAPSRSTSMRCTAPSGIWLMLDDSRGTAPAEIGCGAMRRPLSNTRVLPEPMPRRLTEAASPRASLGPVEVSLLSNPADCGSCPSLSDTVDAPLRRSEEHTSEPQSLMRISYAVFCLQKKKKKNN